MALDKTEQKYGLILSKFNFREQRFSLVRHLARSYSLLCDACGAERVRGSVTTFGFDNNNMKSTISYTRAPRVSGRPYKFHVGIITLVYTPAAHIQQSVIIFAFAKHI